MWQTVGHDNQKEYLNKTAHSDAHAFCFVGPSHIGKYTLARDFAKLLTCEKKTICNTCTQCTTSHNDILDIGDEDSTISVKMIKESLHQLYTNAIGHTRVCIIPDAHRMTTQAANALLKTLEEPPANTKIILTTHKLALLPATIASRIMVVHLQADKTAHHDHPFLYGKHGLQQEQEGDMLAVLNKADSIFSELQTNSLIDTLQEVESLCFKGKDQKEHRRKSRLLANIWRHVALAHLHKELSKKMIRYYADLLNPLEQFLNLTEKTNVNSKLAFEACILDFPQWKNSEASDNTQG